jgi:Notch-like protein
MRCIINNTLLFLGVIFEICNGRDDNCDGQIDEGNPGAGQTCFAAGSCPVGVTVCQGGSIQCKAQPRPESCDGLDNDCNGIVDDVPGGCQNSCTPTPEQCNGKDDDCDGFPDEDNPGGGAPCMLSGGHRGTIQCVQGKQVCWPTGSPSVEGTSGCSVANNSHTNGLAWLLALLALALVRRKY